MSLPELVAFSIKDADQEVRYLSFTGPHRQLRFGSEEGIYSDIVSFTVEQAGSGLVHIRSSFENTYWARASRHEPWLLAYSKEKVDDMTKDECTLFRTQFTPGNLFVNFVHAQSGFNVVMRPAVDAHAYNLCVEQAAPTDFSFIRYIQYRNTKLPKYVMFKGDNGRYLNARSQSGSTVLHFESQSTTDRSVGFEIEYRKHGDLRVKSMGFDGYWGPLPSTAVWRTVVVLPNSNSNDPNTIFEATRSIPAAVAYHGISLRCRGLNLACIYMPSNTSLGLANVPANDHVACLRVEQAVQQGGRRVNIEEYRHPWVRRTSGFYMTRNLTNTTNVEREHLFIEPNIRMQDSTTFRSSVSQFMGPSAVFNGRIPYVTPSGELVFPDEVTSIDSNWGATKLVTNNKTHEEKLILPPNTQVGVSIYKNWVVYEIPFSYQQIDTYPFGGNVTQYLHDGDCTIRYDYGTELRIRHTPIRSASDISELGVEVVPGSGIYEYKCPDEPDEEKADEGDQESDEQADIPPDDPQQCVDVVVGIEADASDQIIQET